MQPDWMEVSNILMQEVLKVLIKVLKATIRNVVNKLYRRVKNFDKRKLEYNKKLTRGKHETAPKDSKYR